MDTARWVIARELRLRGGWREVVVPIGLGEELVVGREGDLPLGVDPEDNGISRVALQITAADRGWRIDVGNRSGARIYPWGLAATTAHAHQSLDWPLVGVRVHCPTEIYQHWVLLESRSSAGAESPTLSGVGTNTRTATRPRPLTEAEAATLQLVFGDFIAWPPRPSATALQLKQAAKRLEVSDSAIQERLKGIVAKARGLGLDRVVRLTEPEYLHVLVGAGYLAPPVLNRG